MAEGVAQRDVYLRFAGFYGSPIYVGTPKRGTTIFKKSTNPCSFNRSHCVLERFLGTDVRVQNRWINLPNASEYWHFRSARNATEFGTLENFQIHIANPFFETQTRHWFPVPASPLELSPLLYYIEKKCKHKIFSIFLCSLYKSVAFLTYENKCWIF